MTDHHDEWAPEDDELVREALMSLMDDVSSEPLPEPAQIRARARGGGASGVVDLDPRRGRRRSMALLAGAAAAALVATGAGLLVVNQSPDTPVATSSTEQPTTASTGSTSAAPSTLRTLTPAEWQTVLGVPVDGTVSGEPEGHCFRPADDTTWQSRSARQADTTRVAGQWIGTSPQGTAPLTRSVDQSVTGCEGYTQEASISHDLTGGGTVRAWHNTGPEDVDVWWVEVSDGSSVSFLTLTEDDGRTYTEEDIRTLALGVLGQVDLTDRSSSSATSSATSSTRATTSTSTPTTTSTTSAEPSTSGSGTPRPTSPTTSTPPTTSPTTSDPSLPVVGDIPSSSFVQPSRWSSRVLTGGEPAVGGQLELEGDITIDACASTSGASRVGGLGIRSGKGSDNFFGRQYILETDTSSQADRLMTNLVRGYSGGCSEGDTRPLAEDSRVDTFVMTEGDLTSYIAVVRQSSTSVTVLRLNTAKTAPRSLTDATADRELARLAGLVRS